jgi:hypothetical protein
MDDLRREMERLGERGEPRGAARVLAAARRESTSKPARNRKLVVGVAIVASVMLVAGIAAAVVSSSDGGPQVAGPTTTAPATTTTEATTTTAAATAVVTSPPSTVPAGVLAASRLQPFKSWTAYLSYVKTKGVATVGAYGLPGIYRGAAGFDVTRQTAAAEGGSGGPEPLAQTLAATGGYSNTNNQEETVDEPDTAKTDGRTIFVIDNTSVLRTLAGTGALRQLGALSVPATSEMLLVGNKVILLGNHYDEAKNTQYVVIAVVDVSRPAAPVLASRFEVEGNLLSARLVGGAPRIVLQSNDPAQSLGFVYPTEQTAEAAAQAQASHRARIQSSDIGAWVPDWIMREGAKRGRTGRLVTYDRIYRPPTFAGFGLLTVMTLNMNDPSASDASSVVADGNIVYGSTNRLYVASTAWGNVSPLLAVEPATETLVHAFDVTAPDRATYRVSGKVSGTVRDQFSMSEYQGVLRIVTTSGIAAAAETSVRTFADQGQVLTEIGRVGGLGPSEQVYGVRFIGPTGYVVTFRQVDPLYVVDLSDPRRPRRRGELKIPGYSAYLHPLDGGLLFGLGAEATEEGRREGFQASVFDVSDPDVPKRLQHHVVPDAASPAEFNHHAFLYWQATRLAVVPLYRGPFQGDQGFQGAVGLRVGRDRLEEVGRIQHPSSGEPEGGRPMILHSLVIGDRLYTTSPAGVLQSDLATLADRTWVPFR